jgi:internalin A
MRGNVHGNRPCCLVLLVGGLIGCGAAETKPTAELGTSSATPTAPALENPMADLVDRLHRDLAAKNPGYQRDKALFEPQEGRLPAAELRGAGITDISPLQGVEFELVGLAENPVADLTPLKGMPLSVLDLEGTQVADLSPLGGMPLRSLWLNRSPVADLTPLKNAPLLSELSVLGTKVTDLSPLSGLPLESLWLNETAVTDVTPIFSCPLITLTLHKTPVADIAGLAKVQTLQRLHLGESAVSDLRPLAGLRLTRLIVTPSRIKEGWDVVRDMTSLRELDVELRESDPKWTPEEFWKRFDAGELR